MLHERRAHTWFFHRHILKTQLSAWGQLVFFSVNEYSVSWEPGTGLKVLVALLN